MARVISSSVTVILFFSPISASTRPSRTRRSAIAAIFLARLLLGRALVGEGAALRLEISLDRSPDVLELVLGQRRRQREPVHLVELVEELPLDPLAADDSELLLQGGP